MKEHIINTWWILLSTISIINVFFISNYLRKINEKNIHFYLGICAFIFTAVCAVRSIWLRKDIERTCITDSKISTPLVGRSLATISEICYIIIIITIFNTIIKEKKGNFSMNIFNKMILPIIIMAEIFSWVGCSTKYELWNALEESLWCIAGIIIFIISTLLYNNLSNLKKNLKDESLSNFLFICILTSFIYIIFMLYNDIPFYIEKWKKNYSKNYNSLSYDNIKKDFGKKNKNLISNLLDMNNCDKVCNDYEEWKDEIPWMTGYFTLGVWSCIAMVIWFKKYTKI